MADRLGVTLSLPTPGAKDVVKREFTYEVAGEIPVAVELNGDVVEHEVVVNEGAVVDVQLVDIDNAGNRSGVSSFNFTATDTTAPPTPGQIGVLRVREIFDEDPAAE